MNEMYIPTMEGNEKKISLEEFYTILSFLESTGVSTADMIMSYSDINDTFILSKVLKNNKEVSKKQNIYFKFDLENDTFIMKNEIRGRMHNDKNVSTLYQDFAKFIKNDDNLERYTVSFYQVFDDDNKTLKEESYDLYIANFLDFYYEKYGVMGNLVTVPIIKDSYEVSSDYKITQGVNNNKMMKKRY